MASYHLSVQTVKRSEGRSVVAMAAYRAGARLKDERRGVDVDFRRRRGVVHTEVLVPEGAAGWLEDRERLWNYVERIEKRRDAQLAREINMALPHELTDAQRLELVGAFVREQFVDLGMVADLAIHRPVPEKGDDPRNFHAHVLLTMRQAEPAGLRRVKTREWNSDAMLIAWRAAWAEHQNAALRKHGHRAGVDHRSFAVRRAEAMVRGDRAALESLKRVPEIHVGPKARKAGRGAPPQSRDRLVGPRRIRASRQAERRALRYTLIDRGSRGQTNVRRLEVNARRLGLVIAKTELRLARFRKALRHYRRRITIASGTGDRSGGHARMREQQVLRLIRELDQVFQALLGIRENQLVRRLAWEQRLQRWRPRDLKPLPGTGRRRYRGLGA